MPTDASIADLAARLRVEIGRLTRQSRQHSRGGFTPSQVSALASLDQRGPMRLGELARVECVAPPTVTKLVASLETTGLVERSVDPDDRRSAVVALTRAGRAALARIRSERTAFLAERIALLSPAERAQLSDALDLMTRLAEPDRTEIPGVIPARLRNSPTFASLEVRNYRIYFVGQVVSLAGTWMQTVAQGLLVVKLHDSATVLGLVVATQFLPVLVIGLWAGVVADRLPKRTLLIVTQVLAAACALTLGLLVATDAVELWMVFVMAALLGIVQAFDNPARQAFVSELVPPHRLANAIGLNSVMINLARIVGPSTAGVLTATVGLAACFFFNALSYVAVIVALVLIRPSELRQAPRATESGQLRAGLEYVWATPILRVTLLLMAVVGTLAYEFPVTLPILAKHAFGDEDLYGPMSALQGVGAVAGGLWVVARFKLRNPKVLAVVATMLGALIIAVSLAPTLPVALVLLVFMGAISIAFISIGNTILQLFAEPTKRGRVMALWSIALIGSTTIGGPFVGWFADQFGARSGLALGGVSAMLAGAATYPALRRLGPDQPRPVDPLPQERVDGAERVGRGTRPGARRPSKHSGASAPRNEAQATGGEQPIAT